MPHGIMLVLDTYLLYHCKSKLWYIYCYVNVIHYISDFLYRFVKEKLVPLVYSEEQFIFLCHLVAPFLSRYNLDKPSPSILDITVELFNALERTDKHVQTLRYMDQICDLLYPFIIYFLISNTKFLKNLLL